MKILSVHNRYLQRAGEDESTESENALLREHGHLVVECFEDNHDLENPISISIGLGAIWSHRSYRRVRGLIAEHSIDLVKIDNFFPQISPAVYYAARRAGVPSVQSLRNFRIGCPGALLFRAGEVCQQCVGKNLAWPGILHGCYRGSRLMSAAPALMATVHRMAGTWNHQVTAYVALTDFSRERFLEIGLPADKIFVKPNFVADIGPGDGQGGFALFVGRLAPEKGIDTLLSAWKLLRNGFRLKIIGNGPLAGLVSAAAATNPLIEWLGDQPLERVYAEMGEAAMVVFPSKWFETFGRVVAESFAKGSPVLAGRLGHMPSMIAHQRSGLLFEQGDPVSLSAEVGWMLDNREKWPAMRKAARDAYEHKYTPERNYARMMEIYACVMDLHRNRHERT